jgi:hypothetical protein
LIENIKCVPIYLRTVEMLADIGTKALDPKLFNLTTTKGDTFSEEPDLLNVHRA